jgi:hypothetical protein
MPTPTNTRHASRQHKRIQRQLVSPQVREALDTEIWIRSTLYSSAKPVCQQELIEEILRWYLSRDNRNIPASYEAGHVSWARMSFWLDRTIVEHYRAIARRDGVTKRQVIGAALTLYSHLMIPSALTRYRRKTATRIKILYRQHHTRPSPKSGS